MHINENVFLDIVPKQNRRKQYATIGRYVIKVNHPSLVTREQNVHIKLSNYFANNQFCNFFCVKFGFIRIATTQDFNFPAKSKVSKSLILCGCR